MKLGRIVLVALVGGAVTAVGATGCSLIVDFDASKIDSGIVNGDASDDSADVGDTADTSQPDTTPAETGNDASDAGDTTVADANDAGDTAVADTADTAVADTADTAVADTSDASDTAVSQICGNAIVEGTEQCDLGGKNGSLNCNYGLTTCSVCSSTCTNATPVTSYCSDGKVDAAHETCDDKNTTSGDGCSSSCGVETGWSCTGAPSACTPICGDGLVKGSETCDLGANNGKLTCAYGATTCTVCSSTCTAATAVTSYCGDGKVDAANGETCDDGNATAGDGCSATCKVESGFACENVTLPSVCASTAGDNNVQWNYLFFNDGATDPSTVTVPNKSYTYLKPSSGTLSSSTTFDVYLLADLGDLTGATIRFWDSVAGMQSLYTMSFVDVTTAAINGQPSHKYAVWKGTIPAHASGTYYYRIYAIDGTATAYLKDGLPMSMPSDCSTSPLNQEICSSDHNDADWQYIIP